MRARAVVALGAVTVMAISCTSGKDANPLADDLKRDLEASATSLELASSSTAQPMRFVSELEQGKAAEPVQRRRAPRPVATNTAGAVPEEKSSPAPESRNEVQVAQVTSEAPQAPQAAPDAPTVPMVAPRPASLPVEVPTDGGGRGYGGGGIGNGPYGGGIGIGDVIGVVIRGGGVGDDHCVPRRRPRGRMLP